MGYDEFHLIGAASVGARSVLPTRPAGIHSLIPRKIICEQYYPREVIASLNVQNSFSVQCGLLRRQEVVRGAQLVIAKA